MALITDVAAILGTAVFTVAVSCEGLGTSDAA
jgi:hypothetical protein